MKLCLEIAIGVFIGGAALVVARGLLYAFADFLTWLEEQIDRRGE